jgi:predicted permease
MNKYLQQIIIISSVFLIILWFQNQDDKKHNKKRKLLYDIYKFPVLISAIVGLLLNYFIDNDSESSVIIMSESVESNMVNQNFVGPACVNKYSLFEVDTGKFD